MKGRNEAGGALRRGGSSGLRDSGQEQLACCRRELADLALHFSEHLLTCLAANLLDLVRSELVTVDLGLAGLEEEYIRAVVSLSIARSNSSDSASSTMAILASSIASLKPASRSRRL